MSTPESVRTKDGVVWTLRTVTSSGIALYAPKGVCECPTFVMATLSELAEHGIQSAELAAAVAEHGAFPVPVGSGSLSAARLAEAEERGAHLYEFGGDATADEWNRLAGDDVPLLVKEIRRQAAEIAELETGIAWRDAERERWSGVHYVVEKAIDKGWNSIDTWELEDALGPEPAPVPAEPVAEPSCPCPPADQPGPHQVGCFFDGVPVSPPSERPVDGLTATFMPVAALREVSSREEPHDSPLHHDWRIGHDLDMPGTGGGS